MTNYQSTGRNQKPRGLRIKQALQFTLILAICIWLLYQIKPSHKNHGLSTWNKLSEEGRTLILGRKGSAAWSSDRSDSGSKGAHIENDATDGGDTENGKEDVIVESDGEKTDIAADDKTGKAGTYLVLDSKNAVIENDMDEIPAEVESESTLQHIGMVSETISSHWKMEDGEHSFPDENGVPQDLVKDYFKFTFRHSSISSTNIQSKTSESNAVPTHDVESKQHKFLAENKDDGTTEDMKNDIRGDAELIMQVKSKDSDDFQTRYSQ